MNQERYAEATAVAEHAFEEKNYSAALEWFQKALEENPEDLYLLSRIGTVCIALEQFQDAFGYFQKALALQPQNGDNAFNLGNAYFFHGDYGKALDYYAEAEMKGCSEEVRPKLYYQKALLCSLRQDVKSALLNFQKYEDADPSHMAALNPDLISEKLKLYIFANDYENAAKCAVQWINLSPGNLRGYLVYFNLLLTEEKFDEAEKILGDAFRYVEKDQDTEFTLRTEQAVLYTSRAEHMPDQAEAYYRQAYTVLDYLFQNAPPEKQKDTGILLMELCMKMQNYDQAISVGAKMLAKPAPQKSVSGNMSVPDDAEIDAMLQNDLLISSQISDEMGAAAEIHYDENGRPFRIYPEGVFKNKSEVSAPANPSAPHPEAVLVEKETLDRIYFTLLSCYLEKEDYEHAAILAEQTAYSNNIYYAYFGRYAAAFSMKQLADADRIFTRQQAEQKYADTIQFFRNRMIQKADSHFAVVFRARMYAELGRFEEAEGMAALMPDAQKLPLLQYINQCRQELTNVQIAG